VDDRKAVPSCAVITNARALLFAVEGQDDRIHVKHQARAGLWEAKELRADLIV